MREIRFRAWDKESKRMYDWKITRQYPMDYTFNSDIVTPMQYTGLKDKNGTEIYKGDVVSNGVFLANVEYLANLAGYYPFSCELKSIYPDECEVIGNIWENPELLK